MKNYDWTRYWYLIEKDKTDSERGFLFDSEKGFLNEYDVKQETCKTLDHYENTHCLILLGEPGVGKSTEIIKEFERIKSKITNEERIEEVSELQEDVQLKKRVESLFVNLGSIQEIFDLYKELFESEIYIEWLKNDYDLYLFLDGLDEALTQINVLTSKLSEKLRAIPNLARHRLFLRISCRSLQWNDLGEFQKFLESFWNTSNDYQQLRLAPLSEQDVILAAISSEINNPNQFVAEIYNKNAEYFASDPTTLQMLINEFKKNSTLSSDQFEIYEKGCLAYCEETSGRVETGRASSLTKEEKYRIAARAAALIIFSNNESVWTTIDTGEHSERDILVKDILGYTEKRVDNTNFDITEERIDIALDTRIFIKSIGKRLKCRTRRIAEFLAAWYLNYREVSDEFVKELLGKRYLPPQLFEVAALIASRRENVSRHLMEISPLVLLRSDLLLTSDKFRKQLVKELLIIFEKGEANDWNFGRYYSKLNHSRLSEQLKPYIEDSNKGFLVRRVAIDIAEACNLTELQDLLATIALTKNENRSTRINAAYAITRIGDSETRKRLKELIYEEDDENLELKGRGLAATWNEHLSAEELFRVLETPPAFFHGSYDLFFYNFLDKLEIKDLPIALKWLKNKIVTDGDSIQIERTSDKILLMAWKNLDQEEIFLNFIEVVIEKLKDHKNLFSSASSFYEENYRQEFEGIKNDTETRRKIWLKILSVIDEENLWLFYNASPIGVGIEDIEWLIEEWKRTDDKKIKTRLLGQLKRFISIWGTHPEALSKILKACEGNNDLDEEFRGMFSERIIGSEESIREKENYEANYGWRKKQKREENETEQPVSPTPLERTLEFIEKFQKGDTETWWQINWFMIFLPTGYSETSELEADITKLPVWKKLKGEDKSKLIKIAKEYLINGDPQNDKWLGKNTIHRPAFAGYRALLLLENFEPEFVEALDENIWLKWTPIIYYYPIYNGSGTEEYEKHCQLIAKAYSKVPDKIIELLWHEIETKSEDSFWSFDKLKYCWDERLIENLKSKYNDVLSISTIRQILTQLFELNDSDVEKIACKNIIYPISEDEKLQEPFILSAELLIRYGKTDCWEAIWRVLVSDVEFSKALIESGVFRFGYKLHDNLTEKQIADLYIWLSKTYPQSEDPKHSGSYSPDARDEIVGWRESFLNYLINKGTEQSVIQLERVTVELPNLPWLKSMLTNATEKMFEKTWKPFSPPELLKQFYLENIRNKISILEKELIPFEKLDRLAKRRAKFRVRETWFLVTTITLFYLWIVISFDWNTMEKWTWFIPIVLWLIMLAIVVWLPTYIYLSLSLEKAFKQDKEELYKTQDFNLNEPEIIRQELEMVKRELESASR
jgi:hypothetical protein